MRKLFDIGADGDVSLQDDTFLLIPELKEVYKDKKLGSKAILWIVLYCDYNSPYRQLLPDKRKEEACYDAFGKKWDKLLESPLVKEACDKYNRLQYDPLIDQYNVYTEKIAEFNEHMRGLEVTKDGAADLAKLMKDVENVNKARESILELIMKKKEENAIAGGGDIPFIETYLQKAV